jgi:DNA-binding NarL/FixJ family response regulator
MPMTGPTTKPASKSSTASVTSPKTVKVALVEDQTKVRENWASLINSFPDFTCVCACVSAEDALVKIPQTAPDVVLMDIFLPRMSGIECTARLKVQMPDVQIVMLTAMDNQELLFMALEAGADGYLLKRTKPSELRSALLDVLGGGVPMTSQIARRLIASFRKTAKTTNESAQLSAREDQILQLVSKGHSNKLIADKLEMSYETVCTHLKRVFKKLHVNSRTEAAILYINSKMSEQRPDADED